MISRNAALTKTGGQSSGCATGRMPDFVIVGAMKAGSTSLWRYLSRHPELYLPVRKELQFFSRDHVFQRGFEWYQDMFGGARPDQKCGEASTCYSRYPVYPDAAARLADAVPHARLIYILRHPVERLYAHYVHEMRLAFLRGETKLPTFEEFVQHDEEALCASRYATQIAHLMSYFQPGQLHVLLLEDIRDQPRSALDAVQVFLDVEPQDLVGDEILHANSAAENANIGIPRRIAEREIHRFRRARGLRGMAELVPPALRRQARRVAQTCLVHLPATHRVVDQFAGHVSSLDPDLRQRLCEGYASETRAISKRIGRPLPHWLK